MKNKLSRKLCSVSAALMLAAAMTGCGASAEESTVTAQSEQTPAVQTETVKESQTNAAESTEQVAETKLSGTVTLAGSTSMEKVCEALMEGFMEAYPDITVTTEYTGSGAGIESLTAGSIDIGNSSRHLKDGEIANGAVENVIALDGIAVITDLSNVTVELTSEDLAGIYTGEITNWSEVGGNDEAIVVIGRENGSGTRSAFEELLKVEDACNYAQELDSTGAVLAKVSSTLGAIGYVSLDVVDDSVNSIVLDGVAATEENIIAGQYQLSRPFVMATMGDIDAQSDLVKTWFEYVMNGEGKDIIREVGLILP